VLWALDENIHFAHFCIRSGRDGRKGGRPRLIETCVVQYIQAVLHSDILVRALLLAGNIGWYPRGAARLLSSKASLLRQQALYLPGQASLSKALERSAGQSRAEQDLCLLPRMKLLHQTARGHHRCASAFSTRASSSETRTCTCCACSQPWAAQRSLVLPGSR